MINVGNRRDFRFELTWLRHPDFLHKVEEIWSTPTRDKIPLNKFLFKLKKVKKALKGWGFNLARSRKQKKKEIIEEIADLELLEEIGNLALQQSRRRIELNVELFKILEEEELYWFRRSHETWFLKGDMNTEYFHKVANGRKRKHTIFSLKDGDTCVSGNADLVRLATEYYKSLFGPGVGNVFEIDSNLWKEYEKVSNVENEELIKPFLEEEITMALFQMEKIKLQGLMGCP
jgi:hypothetical protein